MPKDTPRIDFDSANLRQGVVGEEAAEAGRQQGKTRGVVRTHPDVSLTVIDAGESRGIGFPRKCLTRTLGRSSGLGRSESGRGSVKVNVLPTPVEVVPDPRFFHGIGRVNSLAVCRLKESYIADDGYLSEAPHMRCTDGGLPRELVGAV
jgi:hypothetical protein